MPTLKFFLPVLIVFGGCRDPVIPAEIVGCYMAVGVPPPPDASDVPSLCLVRDGTCAVGPFPATWRSELRGTHGSVRGRGTWTFDSGTTPNRVRLQLTSLDGVDIRSSPKTFFLRTTKDASHIGLELDLDNGSIVRFRYFGELFPVQPPAAASRPNV